jgi:hypothetical protein
MVMIAAGRDEGGLRSHPLHLLKTEHTAIEGQRAIEIGDLEMHVADAYPGIDSRCGWSLRGSGFCLRGHCACSDLIVRWEGGSRFATSTAVPRPASSPAPSLCA